MSMPPTLPVSLRTARLVLRQWTAADAAPLQEAVELSRERLDPWMPWTVFYDRPRAAEGFILGALGSERHGHDRYFGIFDGGTGTLLGGTGLHQIDWGIGAFEIGYWLRTGAEGHGIAQEATRALCRLVFDHLGGSRVRIRCDARNERSRRVPERLGFVHERTARNDDRDPGGALRDTLEYALIASAGEAARAVASWPDDALQIVGWAETGATDAERRGADERPGELAQAFRRPARLLTPRLLLRPASVSDAPEVWAHVQRSGAHLSRWIGLTSPVISPGAAEEWCATAMGNWADRRRFDLLAFSREDGRLVGGGSMPRVRWNVPAVEVGWWLDVGETGRGYATEIGGALVRWASEGWRAQRVSVWCETDNHPSIRVAERLGFRPEGIVRGQLRGGLGAAADFWTGSLIPADVAEITSRLPPTDAVGS